MMAEEARQEALNALERAKAFIVEDMPDRAQAEAMVGVGYALLGGVLLEDPNVDAPITSLATPWGDV